MRSIDTNQPKNLFCASLSQSLALLTLCLICASGSISLAQSGRKQTESQAETAPPKSSQAGRDDKKEQKQAPAFIVVTAAPDSSRHIGAQAGYSQPLTLEYHARSGCLLELKSISGAKVTEDKDVARWEARETALAEDKAWVVWMELGWDKTSSTYDPTPFRLRYLLFEPGTGRIAGSGVGKGVRQTWGKPQQRYSLEEQLRQAGSDIADQVLSELRSRQ
jgi:hypothetical protein